MGLLTLQVIFCASYPEYERTQALPAHVRRAARAIMLCRTAALGGHIHACPDGPMSRIWYNSCRHRSCPQCAYLQTERWLALQQARLLLQLWAVLDHPPVDGGVIYVDAAFQHEFFYMARAQRIRHIPADAG